MNRAVIAATAMASFAGLASCATVHRFLSTGSRPVELVGQWVDSVKSTASDTSVWVLAAGSRNELLRISVHRENGLVTLESKETYNGFWSLRGTMIDSKRALCLRREPRSGPSCTRFDLDTVRSSTGETLKRLVLRSYEGDSPGADRVLLERRRAEPRK